MQRTDVIVLGAGMVGVCAALHLQQRGRSVVLVDRRGPGEETSYGNAGLIQREGVVPYPFPRDITLMARYAFNQLPESNLHWSALPSIAPWLFRYWRASTPEQVAKTARGARPLVERCITEHEALMSEAGLLGLVRRTGYMRVYRSAPALEDAFAKQRSDRETYGVNFQPLDAAKVAELEPHLKDVIAGGVLMPDPGERQRSRRGGAGLCQSCSRSAAGAFVQADARTLEEGRGGWMIGTPRGPLSARRGGGGARPLVRRHLPAARLPLSPRHQARLSPAFQGARQRHAQPAGARRRGRLHAGADDARHPAHDGRGVRPARCTADARAARARHAARAGNFSARRARPNPNSGSGAGPACPTCCRSSAGRRAIAGCGSTSATIIWASRWAPSRGGCWPR